MTNFFVCEAGPMGGISIIFLGESARACLDFVATLDERRQNGCQIYERQDYVDGPPAGDHKDHLKQAINFARCQAVGAVGYVADSNTGERVRHAKSAIHGAFDALEQAAFL